MRANVNGGDKFGHGAEQNQASGRAPVARSLVG